MNLDLDPLPYLTVEGRKPLGYIGKGRERVVFAPRKGYEQDESEYL